MDDDDGGPRPSATFAISGCPPMTTKVDVLVVGGGIVGIAAAREILARRPGISLTVVDKEPSVGRHQTGHNSGVIHSGIYYAPGSLKAQLCTTGASLMYEFCERHGIPADRCGKLIVATTESELQPSTSCTAEAPPTACRAWRWSARPGYMSMSRIAPGYVRSGHPPRESSISPRSPRPWRPMSPGSAG